MSTKKILVIEDNQKHLADAKAFFADKPEYQVEYHDSNIMLTIGNLIGRFYLKSRRDKIDFGYDGVITDLFFPWHEEKYPLEVPAGMGIAMFCNEHQIPCVVNTSGGGHGQRSRWATDILRSMNFPLFAEGFEDDEVAQKKWPQVVEQLDYLINEKRKQSKS